MKAKKNEIRCTAGQCHVREVRNAEGNLVASRTIEGYAIVFNERSVLLDDWGDTFREVIAPEACTQEFLDGCDVKMTLFHNREKLLARYMPGRDNNTLTLEVDEKGVRFSFEAPNTADGDAVLEGVKRGDLTGCSFTFIPDWDESTYGWDSEDQCTIITHHKFRWLGEMTVGSDPAYRQTEVNAREAYQHTDAGKAERERRERSMVEREQEQRARKRKLELDETFLFNS